MEEKDDVKFLSAERLGPYFKGRLGELEDPFSPGSTAISFGQKLAGSFAAGLEKLLGPEVYVKKTDPLFDKIPPRLHGLLKKLHKDGIVKNIRYPRSVPGWPRLPAVAINMFGMNSASSGYAIDYDTASTKATAEALERHSFVFYEERGLPVGKWKDLQRQGAVNPQKFSGFSEKQLLLDDYKRHEVGDGSKFSWMRCVSFTDAGEHLVPTQLVYLTYKFVVDEPQIRQTTTNGGAAGASFEMAVYNAICEAVERDSFMIYWLNRITPPRLDVFNSDNENIRKLARLYKRYEIDFAVLDITTDLAVPAVMTVIREKTPGMPSIFVSPRADLDAEEAIFSSMLDGLRAGFWKLASEEQIEKIKRRAPDVENIEERRIYWCNKSLIKEGDFLFAGTVKKISKNELAGAPLGLKLEKLKEAFKNKKMEVYLAEATSKPAKEAGLRVIMSLIPELCPLYLDEHFKYLGMKRLYQAPVEMGIFEQPKKEEEMNPIPHPML